MSDALDRILSYKREEVAALHSATSIQELSRAADDAPPPRGFIQALNDVAATGENALICEIKRKSPSAGNILPGANPIEIAAQYEAGGAACLSVLTDGPSFGGALSDVTELRAHVGLPILRKDFMLDPIQVHEARAAGADAILVIIAALDDEMALTLTECAHALGMDVLVEAHTKAEVERALHLPSPLIGINNRDLTRMVTELETTETLAPALPNDRQLVSESGISEAEDIIRLRAAGARRFLIGESLMKRDDRQLHVKTLRLAGCD